MRNRTLAVLALSLGLAASLAWLTPRHTPEPRPTVRQEAPQQAPALSEAPRLAPPLVAAVATAAPVPAHPGDTLGPAEVTERDEEGNPVAFRAATEGPTGQGLSPAQIEAEEARSWEAAKPQRVAPLPEPDPNQFGHESLDAMKAYLRAKLRVPEGFDLDLRQPDPSERRVSVTLSPKPRPRPPG